MEAFGMRMRGGLATILSVALIAGGALLATPAAGATEGASRSEAAEASAPTAQALAEEALAEEAPAEGAPTEGTPAQEAPGEKLNPESPEDPGASAPVDAPTTEASGEDESAGIVPPKTHVRAMTASVATTVVQASAAGLNLKFDFSAVPASTLAPPRNAGVYVALVESGTDWPLGGGQFIPNASIINNSGSGSYLVAAADLDRDKSYEALAWYAHGNPTPESTVARGAVELTAADWKAVFPKVWTPALTSVSLADGTPLAAGDTVYKGDRIVVTGSGFDPEANIGGRGMPIPATLPQGSYVVFGKFAEAWQPSSGAAASTRKVGTQAWVLAESVLDQVSPQFQGTIRKQWAELGTDGSFRAELTIADPEGARSATGSYGVFTYGAGGVNNAAQELELRLNYVDSERPVSGGFVPNLKVFLADGTTPYTDQVLKEGDELVVKGSGFDPFANLGGIGQPIPADKPQGTFVVFGKFADDWKPSEKAASDKRTMNATNRGWLLAETTLENDVPERHRAEIRTQWVELDEATGSFSWTVKLTEPSSPLASGNWGIYTYAGGVNTSNAAQELSVPLNYTAKATTDPEGPGDAIGALQWGIYSNFRHYVESNPDGRVETLGAATRTGDIFGFTQTAGGAWDAKSETGELRFSGGVAFFAHRDALSLTIENPILQVTESGAVLTARFDHGPQTPFADVDLSAATRSVAADGAVTWAGATTKMRKEGVAKFLDFYPEGTQLDPLTFTAGAEVETPNTPVIEISGVNVVAEQGLKVDVAATGLPGAIYAALIERGTGSNLDMDDASSYAAFALPFPKVTDGAAAFSLVAPIDKLDRKKQYEVLVWQIHSLPDKKTIYGQANVTVTEAEWDKLLNVKPTPTPSTPPASTLPAAGSLTWGISAGFTAYATCTDIGKYPQFNNHCASKGGITSSFVGGGVGGFIFPQADGGKWNADTRTGTVVYRGIVNFNGYGMTLASFANPVITVNSPLSGTMSVDGQTFRLNLGAASFHENSDGSVTWTDVPVGGSIGSGGYGNGNETGMDPLSFTVGSPSGLSFGSTSTTSKHAATRTPAATPPSSTGLTVVTPAAKLVAGGEIEITAGGFEPSEQGILVVIYSEPTVLDTNAKADKNGVVRWIGKLPKELTGKHTITLQGSINVGQEITIAAADSLTKAKKSGAAPAVASEMQNASAPPNTGPPAWIWWGGALALLVAAAGTTGLVVAQRRKNAR